MFSKRFYSKWLTGYTHDEQQRGWVSCSRTLPTSSPGNWTTDPSVDEWLSDHPPITEHFKYLDLFYQSLQRLACKESNSCTKPEPVQTTRTKKTTSTTEIYMQLQVNWLFVKRLRFDVGLCKLWSWRGSCGPAGEAPHKDKTQWN